MKTKTLTSLLALGCFAALLVSCGGNNTSKMLVKKWQLESIKSDAMDKQMAALKQQVDTTKDSTMKAMLQSEVKMMNDGMESMKNVTMEFKADGSAETVMGGAKGEDAKPEKSNWTVSADSKKLMLSKDGGKKTDTMDINEVSEDKLVLAMKGGQGTLTWKAVK